MGTAVQTSSAAQVVLSSTATRADLAQEEAISHAYQEGYKAGLAAAAAQRSKEQDSVGKSALKGLSWRLFSTTYTVCIAALILGDAIGFDDALQFGVLDFISKFTLFFLHERIWATFL